MYQYWIRILDFFQIKVYSILWVWNTEWIRCKGCTFCALSLYWKKVWNIFRISLQIFSFLKYKVPSSAVEKVRTVIFWLLVIEKLKLKLRFHLFSCKFVLFYTEIVTWKVDLYIFLTCFTCEKRLKGNFSHIENSCI